MINIFKDLQRKGYDVDLVPVSEKGIIDIDKIEKLLRDDTILVSIMHVNNELGSVQPVEDISKIVKSKNKDILFHVDAVQSFCKIPFDVKKINADLVSVSAHKINGPKGVGAVYIKKGTKITPVFLGGGQRGYEVRYRKCSGDMRIRGSRGTFIKRYDSFLSACNGFKK